MAVMMVELTVDEMAVKKAVMKVDVKAAMLVV